MHWIAVHLRGERIVVGVVVGSLVAAALATAHRATQLAGASVQAAGDNRASRRPRLVCQSY